MLRYLLLSLCLLSAAVYPAQAQEQPIRQGERLTLQRCIEIALKMQPSVLGSRYTVQTKEALLGQAKAPYYPNVNATGGFTHYDAVKKTGDPKPTIDTYNSETASVTLSQTLFDFGKTGTGVKVKRFDLESSRQDLNDVTTTVVNDIRQAYFSVLKARRTREVNRETIGQYREHLAQARVRFEAGIRPKYDVTKAEVDLGDAELQLITAENDLEVAWVTLNNAMGYTGGAAYDIEDNLAFQQYDLTLEDALKKAYENRPDLKSLLAQKESAEQAVEYAKKDYYPSLTGNAGYVFAGSQFPLEQGWNAGVALNMNLFQGNLTKNKVEEARARVKMAEANIETKRLQILSEVKKAYLSLLQARKSISNTEIQIRQGAENLELANLRYSSGLGDPLEVTDATVAYSKAKLSNITALYSHITARASIEKAMGNR
jgi:outer membrane protein